jgi:hypothetical protein
MSHWDQLRAWLRALVRSAPAPAPEPSPPVELPPILRPRVLLINYDPVIQAEGGRKLSQVLRWNDVDALCQGYIDDLRESSGGFVDYQIVQTIEPETWPVKEDGFRYDADTFLRCIRSGRGFHQPDTVSYEAILADFDLPARVHADQIDEVWLFAFPYAGFYESRMVGPGAFWCNAPEMRRDDLSRRFVVMGFNYQRGVGEMLESFGHRTESILKHVWRRVPGEDNLWERFFRYDKIAPGRANVGWMHYAPNSIRDYDWGNQTYVRSSCDDWLNFPDFRSLSRQVNCQDWGNGDIREHHRWWFRHLPKAPGYTRGIANNWWLYAVDPNYVG